MRQPMHNVVEIFGRFYQTENSYIAVGADQPRVSWGCTKGCVYDPQTHEILMARSEEQPEQGEW